MAKTRSPYPFPEKKNNNEIENLQAAAFILEEKPQNALLYNSQFIDQLINGSEAGDDAAAWYYWGRLPELSYVSRYLSNSLSVSTLYVGKEDPLGGAPVRLPEDHPASQLLAEFAGGFAGQSELLDRLGTHLTVVGDSILIGPKNGTGTLEAPFDQWQTYSTDEIHSRNGKIYLRIPGNSREVQVPDECLKVRIWRPHPRARYRADSPVKRSFQVLKELDMLNNHIISSASSRLSGAGLLLIPEEFDLPGSDTETEGTEIDRFVSLLIEVMGLAKKNPESPAAQIPVMARGPADVIDKWKHMDFSTEFSNMVPELRMGAIRRLALGMDIPPEILLGTAESNSWSAAQTDSSALRVHLVPLLQLITASLTVGWLRPMLEELPLSEAQKEELSKIVVHYDVSNLKVHQDPSGDAQALYDRYGIDAHALRQSIGYGKDAAPDDKELARQILLGLITTGQPELVLYALGGLRDNYGIKDLPKPPAPPEVPGPAPGNQPGQGTAPKSTSPISSNVPGERSQKKQLSPPQVPKNNADPNNNAEK